MKTSIGTALLSLVFISNSFAQSGKLNKDTSVFSKSPLYVIKFKNQPFEYVSMPMLSLLPQGDIQSMEIYKGKEADSLYSGKSKNGVIVITVKNESNIGVLTKNALLEKYHIKKKYNDLPVFIDSTITYKNDEHIFGTDHIKTINVAKEKKTGKKYISIITDIIKYKPDPNVIYIRGTGEKAT